MMNWRLLVWQSPLSVGGLVLVPDFLKQLVGPMQALGYLILLIHRSWLEEDDEGLSIKNKNSPMPSLVTWFEVQSYNTFKTSVITSALSHL